MALNPGDVIDGKYRIVRLLGEGGMGAVFEGENVRIHRRVAIKVLHGGVAENADAVQRFEREAQAAGRIGSEHIVEVLDLGNLESGDRYMVMEFMDGSSLSDRISARGRLPPPELYPIARQLLEGLAAAHGAGIIHRDLKPDNVYLIKSRGGTTDFVKILDFGISKFSALSGDSGFSMTRTGAVMGTPYYMSPEQAKGAKDMDHRADLYAVGVILYEAVTGQVPFNADTFNELLFKIVLETPVPVRQIVTDLDEGFADIIEKAMAREPSQRFATAIEFKEALEAWASGNPQAFAKPVAAAATPAPTPGGAAAAPALKATPEPWSQSSGDLGNAPAKKKSSTPLIAAAAAVVLLGGGAALALGGSKGAEAAAPPPPAPTQVAAPATTAAPTAPPPATTTAAPPPTAAPTASAEATAAATAEAAKPTAVRRTGGGAAPAPTAKPTATAKPGGNTGTAGGRTIRTDI